MIAVSDSFKKAIKSDNREIHGYVDVVYDKKDGEYSVTQLPTISPLSKQDGSDLLDGVTRMKNYATLENNYFLLDGSFILANSNTLENSGGFISEDVFENISDKTITLVSTETGYVTTKGFTIFFKDNIPFDFDVVITTEYGEDDEEDTTIIFEVRNNTSRNYQKIFEEDTTIKKLDLIIYTTEYNDRRIRITDIYLSLANVYEGEELVKFEVNEEIDLLIENLPINTCTINLSDYIDNDGHSMFDPIDPTGIVPFLTKNTTMQPYIGVLTDDNGIEYVPMGKFYLTDWSNDNDGNVTLNGSDTLDMLKNITIHSDGSFLYPDLSGRELSDYFSNMTGYDFDIRSFALSSWFIKKTNLTDWLKAFAGMMVYQNYDDYQYLIIYTFKTNRQGAVSFVARDENSVDSISRKELLHDVKYETKSVVNKVDVKYLYTDVYSSPVSNVTLKDGYTLNSNEDYIWYTLEGYVVPYSPNNRFTYTTSGTGTATVIDRNRHLIYVRFTGEPGDTFTISYVYDTFTKSTEKTISLNNDVKVGDTLTLDFIDYGFLNDSAETWYKESANYYLNYDAKYIITSDTIGDPSLECGDTVSIQTRYDSENDGYKDVIITKQKFTYDGGLECELEGRGN